MRPLPVNLLPEESTLPTWRSLRSQFLPSGLSNRWMHATSQSSDFTLIAWMNHIFKTILKVLKPASVYFYFLDSEKQKALNTSPKCCCCWGPDTEFFSSFSSSVLIEIAIFTTDSNTREHRDSGTQDIPSLYTHTRFQYVSIHSRPTPMLMMLEA